MAAREQNRFRSIDGDLTAFRTAWLRAVALAWSDEEFCRYLVAEPIKALERYFSFAWPWPNDVLDFTVEQQPDFQWVGDDWVWPLDKEDALLLRLPIDPRVGEGRDPLPAEHRALALADYYDVRPSIFGTAGGGGATPRGQSLITSASIDVTDPVGSFSIADLLLTSSPIRFGGHHSPPGGFVPSGGNFMDFEVVLIAGLAKAWDNPHFAELLKTNTRTVLQSIRGFTTPWRLIIQVEDDKDAYWTPGARANGEIRPSKWTNLGPAVLTLNLPSRPRVVEDHVVALASYNSTGAEFPFTCCA